MLPFPDLLDQENAMRKSLAEQVQNGNLSLLERNQQITKFHSKMLTEEQSRLLANPQQMRRPGCGNAVAAVKSRWLRNPEREQGKLH
jgi:hypothetical protein